MNLGKNFGQRTAATGGTKFPECKGYKFVITNVVDAPSKGGKDMICFFSDIAEGEFAGFYANERNQRLYQLYDSDDGFDRLKGIMDVVIAENPNMFPEAEIDWENFNEKRLIGCTVGGVLKWSDDGKYTNMHYFTTVEEALKKEATPRPARKEEEITDETTGKKLF